MERVLTVSQSLPQLHRNDAGELYSGDGTRLITARITKAIRPSSRHYSLSNTYSFYSIYALPQSEPEDAREIMLPLHDFDLHTENGGE